MARTPGARGVGVRHEVGEYPAGPGLAAPAGLGLGRHPGAEQSRPGDWERLHVPEQKAELGIEAKANRPAPARGSPAP